MAIQAMTIQATAFRIVAHLERTIKCHFIEAFLDSSLNVDLPQAMAT